MRIFKRLNLIDEAAKRLADDLYSRVPPAWADSIKNEKDKKIIKKYMREKAYVVSRYINIKNELNLGIYSKSRLMKKFSSRLDELGYDSDIIKMIQEEMLMFSAEK